MAGPYKNIDEVPEFKPGDPGSASVLNLLVGNAKRKLVIQGPGVHHHRTSQYDIISIRQVERLVIPARLTGRSTDPDKPGYFLWTEQTFNSSLRKWEDVTSNPITSTTRGEARESGGRRAVPLGQTVFLTLSRFVREPAPGAELVLEFDSPMKSILAAITGNDPITDHTRWKYAWREVELVGDTFTTVSDGLEGTTSVDYALNTIESPNTAAGVLGGDGVDPAGSGYPTAATFRRRPIGGGGSTATHKKQTVVELTERPESNGNMRFVFTVLNSHDGPCT